MLRGLRIWLLHALAFVAGLIVSAVVATGLMVLVPRDGPASGLLPFAIATVGVALALGYLAYVALICVLLDITAGPALKWIGPVLLAVVMAGVIGLTFTGITTPTESSLLGYCLLFLTGGIWLTLRPEESDG